MEDLQQKIIELMDLFDDEVVTTADKIDRPQRALDREAIDDFMKRNPMAGGGMLVQPSVDGSRPGYAKDYAKEEEKITGEFAGDPLLKIKSREVDLRAMENERKEEEGQERLNLDKMKAMMNQENQEAKLEQNEKLAGLRAGVSLAKQQMADASKIHDFGRNFPKKKV